MTVPRTLAVLVICAGALVNGSSAPAATSHEFQLRVLSGPPSMVTGGDATRIRGARFLPLEGRNHILLEQDPAWPVFLAELRAFIGAPEVFTRESLEDLTQRELEVLDLVADGLSNEEIGARLHVSARTVERHLSNVYSKLQISGKAARAAAAARFSAARR